MNETLENLEERPQTDSKDLMLRVIEMGKFVGMREAFALVAGRCAAADVECLRRLRDEQKYRDLGCSWDEFCTRHLKVSRRSVDRLIGRLEEFGPAYFHLTRLTHISIGEYRQIAASVSEAGLKLDGSVVALLPENSDTLSAAIAELLARLGPPEPGGSLAAELPAAEGQPIDDQDARPASSPAGRVIQRCAEVHAMLRDLGPLDAETATNLMSAIWTLIHAARDAGYFLTSS